MWSTSTIPQAVRITHRAFRRSPTLPQGTLQPSPITYTHKESTFTTQYTIHNLIEATLRQVSSRSRRSNASIINQYENPIIRHLRIELSNPMDLPEMLYQNPSVNESIFRDFRRSRIPKIQPSPMANIFTFSESPWKIEYFS